MILFISRLEIKYDKFVDLGFMLIFSLFKVGRNFKFDIGFYFLNYSVLGYVGCRK